MRGTRKGQELQGRDGVEIPRESPGNVQGSGQGGGTQDIDSAILVKCKRQSLRSQERGSVPVSLTVGWLSHCQTWDSKCSRVGGFLCLTDGTRTELVTEPVLTGKAGGDRS